MPVTNPKVLCPHACLTPTTLSSHRALLMPQDMLLRALSEPPTPPSSMSLYTPAPTSLPSLPPLSAPTWNALFSCFPYSPLFSAFSFSFPLLSLFLPPTDRQQQEQPCTPSPSRFHGSGPNTNSPGPPTFCLALGVGLGGQMRSLPQAPQQASRPVRGGSVCLLLFPWQLVGPLPHFHP